MIPIQNIYYLLCYAWGQLEEAELIEVDVENFNHLPDLLAKVFIRGTTPLMKKGLDRSYIEVEEIRSGLKGKLQTSATIKKNLWPLAKTVCSYDEFSYDILPNQILKSTFRYLIKTDNIDADLKSQCLHLFRRFPAVSEVALQPALFAKVRLPRHNPHYRLLFSVAQLIVEQLIPNEESGTFWFRDFVREEAKMARLFEAFVRNFCKHHFPQHRVYREDIYWQVSADEQTRGLLPKMQTDISIDSASQKLIIDTKFYQEALRKNFDSYKLHEPNLYQLFAYLKNVESKDARSRFCNGLLLYPTTTHSLRSAMQIDQHTLHVRTLNLHQPWQQIEKDLMEIVTESFELYQGDSTEKPPWSN